MCTPREMRDTPGLLSCRMGALLEGMWWYIFGLLKSVSRFRSISWGSQHRKSLVVGVCNRNKDGIGDTCKTCLEIKDWSGFSSEIVLMRMMFLSTVVGWRVRFKVVA